MPERSERLGARARQALPRSASTASLSERSADPHWPQLAFEASVGSRFQLRKVLGTGSSGVVFEALDRSSGEAVALKVLRHDDSASLVRLKSEFRALAAIAHPNLVTMHELCIDARQRGFFTMALVRGVSFLEYVCPSDNGYDEARLRACLVQLALGVRHLHEHGLLHCDLKPSNVLVSPSGQLSIVDFGLTQPRRETVRSTRFEGTPAYAAPEQCDPARTGCASDWYAVGVMLYEALAGERPLDGNARELIEQKALHAAMPPSQRVAWPVSRELERICLRLLERDPTRRADGMSLLAALGHARVAPAGTGEPRRWPFVGREPELAQLTAAWSRSLAGEPSTLMLRGTSGIGKTTLAQHFLATLGERALVLRARCFVQEALHFNALDGVVDALSHHLRDLDAAELEAMLPADTWLLAQVFPVLRRVPGVATARASSAVLDPRDLRVLAFSALRELLQRMAAKTPLVLFIDDVHWADQDSARLLRELITPPLRAVWLLATFRRDCESCLLEDHALASQLSWLEVDALPELAVTELARRVIVGLDATRQHAIARGSGGHPLMARELIRHACEHRNAELCDGMALETALQSRLVTLTPEARSVLELVCVAGQRVPRSLLFDPAVGASLAALRELRLGNALRESVMGAEVQLEPYHDSVRQVVHAQLTAARQRALHGMLAELMLARGDAYLERVVAHYRLAHRTRDAAALAERAAWQAADQLAFHSAASLLELALEHASEPAERQRLRLAAAEACDRAGRVLGAAQHYERAAEACGEPAAESELRLRALVAYSTSGHAEPARKLLSLLAAELEVPLEFVPMGRTKMLLSFAVLLLTGAPFLRKPATDSSKPPHTALRLLWRAAPSLLVTEPIVACYFAQHALALAARQGERTVYGQALSFHLGLLTLIFGRRSWLLNHHFARARKLTASAGDASERAFVRVTEAGASLLRGEPQRAIELAMEVATSKQLGSPFAATVRTNARSVVLPGLFALGRIARLSELAESWIRDAVDCGDKHMEVGARVLGAYRYVRLDDAARAQNEIALAAQIELDYVHAARTDPWWQARIWLYRGQPEQALAVCERMREGFGHYAAHSDPTRVEWFAIEGMCAATMAARGQHRERSMRLLERCARGARRAVSAGAPPVAAQLAASLCLLRGHNRAGLRQLERAVSHCDAQQLRLRAASLRLSLARLDARNAREHERRALRVFAEEGIAAPARWACMLAPGLAIDPFDEL